LENRYLQVSSISGRTSAPPILRHSHLVPVIHKTPHLFTPPPSFFLFFFFPCSEHSNQSYFKTFPFPKWFALGHLFFFLFPLCLFPQDRSFRTGPFIQIPDQARSFLLQAKPTPLRSDNFSTFDLEGRIFPAFTPVHPH